MLARLPWSPTYQAAAVPPRLSRARLHKEPIVRRLADILATGDPTPFAFEGACRAGLRSRLCLEGRPWREADDLARRLVELALHRIGAARPAWGEGQPEAIDRVVEHWYCAICGRPIPDGRRFRFCSGECARTAKNRRNEASHRDMAEATRLAFQAARAKGEALTRTCARCGAEFAIKGSRHTELAQRYCGQECAAAAVGERTRRAPRPCKLCGQPVKRAKQLYCSPECQAAAIRKVREPRRCASCGAEFTVDFAYRPNRFCSRQCASDALRSARRGGLVCEVDPG